MSGAAPDKADTLDKVTHDLFAAWGYNFYRVEAQLRADEVLIRTQTVALLGRARRDITAAEALYRRDFLPPLTRERSRHDPAAVAAVQAIERLGRALHSIETQINHQPAPENVQMARRYAPKGTSLQTMIARDQLVAQDQQLAGQAERLRASVEGKDGAWLAAKADELQAQVRELGETMHRRQALLPR